MNRRDVLRTMGTVIAVGSVAGCSGDPETEGVDDDPISASPESLVLNIRDFDEEGWRASGERSDEGFARSEFVKTGTTTQQITSEAWIFDESSTAQEEYQTRVDQIQDQYSTKESGIAFEGITWKATIAYSLFRDSNVIGEVSHVEVIANSPDGSTSTALDYSEMMHLKWR